LEIDRSLWGYLARVMLHRRIAADLGADNLIHQNPETAATLELYDGPRQVAE
jgi:hypothetical protein